MDLSILDQNAQESEKIKNRSYKLIASEEGVVALERIEIKKTLENLYKSMLQLLMHDLKEFQSNKGKSAHAVSTIKINSSKPLIATIYGLILRAIFKDVHYFFDNEGHLISLKEIEKLTRKKYGDSQNLCYEVIFQYLKDHTLEQPLYSDDPSSPGEQALITNLPNLPFPPSLEKTIINENERLCFMMLQRLFPLRSNTKEAMGIPMESINHVLTIYNEFLSTPRLFKLIELGLDLTPEELPYAQKLRMLRLCALWCESNMFYKEKTQPSVFEAFESLQNKCISSIDINIQQNGLELRYYFANNEMDNKLTNETSLSTERYINKVISGKCESLWLDNLIELMCTDIKLQSAYCTSLATPHELIKESTPESLLEAESFNNRLRNYVNASYLNLIQQIIKEKAQRKLAHDKEHDAGKSISNFIGLFISLAHSLAVKHDFASAFAIFTALGSGELGRYIEKTKPSKRKYRSSDPLVMPSKPSYKIFSHADLTAKWDYLSALYNPDTHFANLNAKINECRDKQLFFVPVFALLKAKAVLGVERGAQKAIAESPNTEERFSKLHNKASLFWWINSLLQEVRAGLKNNLATQSLQTDISQQLMRQSDKDD